VLAQAREPFFTTKTHVGGTGLGLSVSSDIARAHGGELLLESEPGSGTRVVLRLPWDTGLRVDGPHAPSAAPPERAPDDDALRVLLVDDDGMVRRAYERLLAPECEVRSFSSAAETLRWLGRGDADVDLIICDVEMPGMNGLAFLQALEASHPDLVPRLVFYTGGVFESDRAAALVSQGVRLLTKPVSRATLLSVAARSAARRKDATTR
jgi:CheY-like chemotaxis protein